MNLCCPSCRSVFELDGEQFENVVCPKCQNAISLEGMLSIDELATKTTDFNSTLLEPGANIAHFRIERILGRGGFGTVYAAFDERLERTVALKIPRMNKLSLFQVDSFFREAQAAAQLRHPNIVGVHEVGREGDRVYIVSDYVEGATLADWNDDSKRTPKQAAQIISEIAQAMHVAHEKGIVHRDLKPRNILIDENGKPMITDFGLAKRENPDQDTISSRGQVMGTPAYMAPEQATGKSEHADRRTDVYSLGVVLYELLAGRRPFIGDSGLVIDEVIEGNAPPIRRFSPQIPKDLEAICLKAIATNPGDRFNSAMEFSNELDRFVNDQPTLTRPLTKFQRGVRLLKSNLVLICVLGVVASLIGSVVYLASSRPTNPDNRVPVTFKTSPPRADVAIVKVDLEKGRVDYDNILSPETTDEGCFIKLEPGWYIIEASIPGFGIQEVWRYVPTGPGDFRIPELANYSWQLDDQNIITLPVIRIHETKLFESKGVIGEEPMILVRGAEFTSGSEGLTRLDGSPRRPKSQIQIQDFYLGKFEVSFEHFDKLMKRRNYVMKRNFDGGVIPENAPVTNVSFYEALEYCERLGMRLPVFDEYLFAATNGGTTKFPWGDDMKLNGGLAEGWKPRSIGQPEYDHTLQTPNIGNLFSSVLEWTQEVDLMLSMRTSVALNQPFFAENQNSRIVVGGPPECVNSNSPQASSILSPAFFLDVQPNKIDHNGLGFRCAKSTVPRLQSSTTETNKNGRR